MIKTPRKIALLATIAILFLGGFAAQERPAEDLYPTGLIPPSAEELDEILNTWPRVIRVNLNWLGFERVNEVRAGKGLEPLDPRLVRPVGREVESSIGDRDVRVRSFDGDPDLLGHLPVSADNSQLPYFPPIRSQSPLGSCASFSTVYTQLSYMAAFQRNLDIRDNNDNTNKYSPKWAYNMLNQGSDSGSSLFGNYKLLEGHGACTWAEFPYDGDFRAWCLNTSAWRNALDARIHRVQYIDSASSDVGIETLKELLVNGYVLVFATYISSWQYKVIPDDPSTPDDDPEVGKRCAHWLDGTEGGHAMVIVGYNDAIWSDINGNGLVDPGEKGAFRIANSWGDWWQDAGFVWLAYDALRSVSAVPGGPSEGRVQALWNDRGYVLTVRDGYSPMMIAEFTVNHAKRNQLRINLGRSDTSTETPSTVWTPWAIKNYGGPYAFDGSTTAVDGTFVFDFTELLVEGGATLRYHLGMHDNAAGDPATLSAYKIVDLTTDPPTELLSSLVPLAADGGQSVYSYVDYAYVGPVYNHPPELFYPQVNPAIGGTDTTFSYYVYYYDQNGDVPSVKQVYIDGDPQQMEFNAAQGGSATNGWYVYRTTLPRGSYDYYFYFEDGRGGSARAPIVGTLSGPEVFDVVLTSLQPSSAMAGDPAFVLTVQGADIADGAVVMWDGSDRPTTYVSSSRVDAQIAAADLADGKNVQVTIRNPGGEISNALTFTIDNPVPSLNTLSPAQVSGGGSGSGFNLTLTGSNFVPGSVVRWNGNIKNTTYVSGTELQAAIPSSDISAPGEVQVTVSNPFPGGGASNAVTFAVTTFTLGASPVSATVTAGQSATYTIQVTPQYGWFDSIVSLNCAWLPSGCTATFSPASVTPGAGPATATLTLRTTARTAATGGAGAMFGSTGSVPPAAGLLLLMPAFLLWARFRRPVPTRLSWRRLTAAAVLICVAILIGGCSAGGGGGDKPSPGTPAGTYQIQVRGASGSLSVSTSVTLVVQ